MTAPLLFKGPFSVEVSDDDTVDLLDGDGCRVDTFNTHTQLPLDRQDLLDEEREDWRKWAQHLADCLNAHDADAMMIKRPEPTP